jgi:hypothetical protein
MEKQSGIVNIRGREYKTVALRVEEFRAEHPIDKSWGITTELLECTAEQVIVKATILTPEGLIVATGHAQEKWTGTINKTSAVENAETSSIGRALAAAGWAGQEFASADELAEAIGQQRAGHTNRPPQRPSVVTERQLGGLKTAWLEKHIDEVGQLTDTEKAFQFALWAKKQCGRKTDWNANDSTQWQNDDMAKCLKAAK